IIRRTGPVRPARSTPTITGGVDEHADPLVEATTDQLLTQMLGKGELIDILGPVHPLRLPYRGTGDGLLDGEIVLDRGRVVGGVGDETVHILGGGPVGVGGLVEQFGRGREVVLPTDPTVVAGVHVVVDVVQGPQLGQGITHTFDVVAVGQHLVALFGGGLAVADVGDQVGQGVDLDGGDHTQVGVLVVGQDVHDRVDVFVLVAVDLFRSQFTVGGQGGTVAAGQVVDDQLEDQGPAVCLLDGLVQVVTQAQVAGGGAGGVIDAADSVQPHAGGRIGDGLDAGFGGGVGRPDRVHVHIGTLMGVVNTLTGIAGVTGVTGVTGVHGPFAKDSVEREGAGGGVGARVVGVEAEVDRLIGGDRCVVPRVGGGNTLAALCQRGAPRVADLLVSGKVPFQGPVVDDVAVVGDLDLCGEAGSPVVGDRVIDGTARGGTRRAHGDKGKCGANSTSGEDGGAFSRTRGSGSRVAMDSAHASTASGFPAGRGGAVDSRVDSMHTNPFFCSMERCGGARVKASPGMFGSVPSRAVDRWDHGLTSAESATQQRKDCVGRGMRKRA